MKLSFYQKVFIMLVCLVGLQMTLGSNYEASHSTPIVPKYVAISFETNGGTSIDELSVPYNDKVYDLPVPLKEGYHFEGWYEDRYFLSRWEDGSIARINLTLFAKWTALQPTPNPNPMPTPQPIPNPGPKPIPPTPTPTPNPIPEPKPVPPEIPTIQFSDTQNHWAQDIIGKIAAQGIIDGYPDGKFGPNDPVRREHIAVMIQRAMKLVPTKEINAFNDVPKSHPNYEAIMALAKAGIIEGYAGKFKPNAPMTRAELAKVLVLAFDLTAGGISTFADVSRNHWSASYISALADAGIAFGNNGLFLPNEPVTRAQFVVFLYRALNI
ncbi:hypothetical protein DCE79_01705 [Lysinibacillus sp. 2017]|uniref:S-layer homology domain-containing protein n=1 Tax=unclassified Lysinibacillus TaxID=2636778 RepID=UPI000D52738C|nr:MULTISPECIES: S-layer homology domain-containing protein [unclassified Lysinibacillus]AWE06176.1 hypothetical protein DCE79_01705 [Lysinibacillus sp. 2017]TGN35171.1 hypothetical protein E4L99_10925 [Lysinibacillus sp. S2017]